MKLLNSIGGAVRLGRATQTKSLGKEKLIHRYDKEFAELMLRLGRTAAPSAATLQRFNLILYDLLPEIRAWTGDARLRMYLLMHEIRKQLDDPSAARASLDLLALILSNGGRGASELARPILREKILEMHSEPEYDNERLLPRVLHLLGD